MGSGGTGAGAGAGGGGYSGGGLANTGGTGYGGDLGGYGTAGEMSSGAGGAGMAGYGGAGIGGGSGGNGGYGGGGANTPQSGPGWHTAYVHGDPVRVANAPAAPRSAPAGPPTSGNLGGTGYGGDLGGYGTAGEMSGGAGGAGLAGYGGGGIAGVQGSGFGGPGGSAGRAAGFGGPIGGVSAPSTAVTHFSQSLPTMTSPLMVNKSKLTMQPATPFAMTRPGIRSKGMPGQTLMHDLGVFRAPPGLAAPMRGMGPFGTNMASPGGTFGADLGIGTSVNPSFNGNSRVGQGPSTGGSNVGAKGPLGGGPTGFGR